LQSLSAATVSLPGALGQYYRRQARRLSARPKTHYVVRPDPENVRRPCIECRRTLASEIMPLVNSGDAAELRRLVRQQLIDNDAVKAESRQSGYPSSSKIMQAPGSSCGGLAPGFGPGFSARLLDRRIEVPLTLRRNLIWASVRDGDCP